MGDDPGRLHLVSGDHVTQLPVVLLRRALAGPDGLALEPVQAVVDGNLALLASSVSPPGSAHEDPDDADPTGEATEAISRFNVSAGSSVPCGYGNSVAFDTTPRIIRGIRRFMPEAVRVPSCAGPLRTSYSPRSISLTERPETDRF